MRRTLQNPTVVDNEGPPWLGTVSRLVPYLRHVTSTPDTPTACVNPHVPRTPTLGDLHFQMCCCTIDNDAPSLGSDYHLWLYTEQTSSRLYVEYRARKLKQQTLGRPSKDSVAAALVAYDVRYVGTFAQSVARMVKQVQTGTKQSPFVSSFINRRTCSTGS